MGAFQLSDSQELLASQENFTTFLNTQNTASENLNLEVEAAAAVVTRRGLGGRLHSA